jgi:hypothetical protein
MPGVLRADAALLRRLEERLLDLAVRASGEEVAALLADDFVEFGGSGRVFGKQQIVEALRVESPVRRTLADFRARWLAPGVVLVTYRVSRHDADGGAVPSLRSSVWERVEGRWRLVFHQGTPVRDERRGEAGAR